MVLELVVTELEIESWYASVTFKRYTAELTVFAVEWPVAPVDTDDGFPVTPVAVPISLYAPAPFSWYCHCQLVISTFGLFLVITALMVDATFPFSLLV